MTESIETLDEIMLAQAILCARAAARERAVALNLTANHEKRYGGGDLFAETKKGDELRARIRDAEKHAKVQDDQALSIRRQLLGEGPRTRGPGKKAPLEPEKPARDPATAALIEKHRAKKERASANGRLGYEARVANEAARDGRVMSSTGLVKPFDGVDARETCEACGSEMSVVDAEKHAEVCVG